jgi:hypothetical protein
MPSSMPLIAVISAGIGRQAIRERTVDCDIINIACDYLGCAWSFASITDYCPLSRGLPAGNTADDPSIG